MEVLLQDLIISKKSMGTESVKKTLEKINNSMTPTDTCGGDALLSLWAPHSVCG